MVVRIVDLTLGLNHDPLTWLEPYLLRSTDRVVLSMAASKVVEGTRHSRVWSVCGAERTQPTATRGKPSHPDGKEGVDGSSPSEGFTNPLLTGFLVVC
jgi:hypothetical protein